MTDVDIRGRFLWHELMTTDPAKAQEFYTKVIGWGLQTWNDLGSPYVMFTRDETGLAGIMELPDDAKKMGAPPHWLAYIGTPTVDEAVRQATSLGAKTYVPATDIPTVGRFAVLGDPQGAIFAVFAPASATSPEAAAGGREFSWHELATTDCAAAFAFYRALFSWEKTGEFDMGPMGMYQMYGRGGKTLGGMFNKPATMKAPPNWLGYVRVGDIRKGAEAVKANGGQVINGPMEVPGGDWILQALDPQGAAFALHQKK
jgi:predicted enzyme related to lactoylglutathione lyase